MDRRSFLEMGAAAISGAMPAANAAGKKTNIYVLEQFYLKNGTQLGRINDFMSKVFLPAASKIHSGPKIFLEALVAPHMPQFALIMGFESLDEFMGMRSKLTANQGFSAAGETWEAGPEPPYEHYSESVLEATGYSPEIAASPAGAPPRIFELRVYHSPTWRQLKALHDRFAGPEVKIFHRVGVNPILYTSTMFGANMPNLTYVIPFESLAAREKAWNAFSADPEWVKVRKESVDHHGQISSVIQISLYKATPYSPVR